MPRRIGSAAGLSICQQEGPRAHYQAAADACSKPPIASRVTSSVSSSVNGSSMLMLNGSCANSSRFRTKMLHWPISQMATHKATQVCNYGDHS